MRFTCQGCGRTYIVAQELAGLAFKMKCRTCGHVIAVRPAAPTPAQVAAPPVAPAASPPSPEPPKAPPPVQAAPVPEVAAAPPRPRRRRMPNPRLHQPTFVLSAILAVLVAVYFYLNRDLAPKPAREPAAPQAVPSPDPANRTTAGSRLP